MAVSQGDPTHRLGTSNRWARRRSIKKSKKQSTSSGSSSSSSSSGKYGTAYKKSKDSFSPEQIASIAYQAGFRGSALADAVAIALAESRGNPNAHNPTGEDSRGLWQINVDPNTSWGRQRLQKYGNLYDPLVNARAAFEISQQGKNFRPWTTYAGTSSAGRSNSHKRFYQDAVRAAQQVEGGRVSPVPNLASRRRNVDTVAERSGGKANDLLYRDPARPALLEMLNQQIQQNREVPNPVEAATVNLAGSSVESLMSNTQKAEGLKEIQAAGLGEIMPQQQMSAFGTQSNIMEMPFFDPAFEELKRQQALSQAHGMEDLTLQKNRLIEDQNLFQPYMQRRFGQQADQVASSVAGRGFHGRRQSPMTRALGNLTADQSYTQSQYSRQNTRGMEDIERAIARLTESGLIGVGEGARGAAGNASRRIYPTYQ